MRPLSNPADLVVGQVIHHQPRNHYYRIMNKTMIKKDGGGWEYGWSYQEVEMIGTIVEANFKLKTEAEIYSRGFSLFDSDWFLAY